MRFATIDDIRAANEAAGLHFFERSTMRFFDSRVGSRVFGGRYFVSSERFDTFSPRLYTIREAHEDGNIDTVGEFQAFETRRDAEREVERLLADQSAEVAS